MPDQTSPYWDGAQLSVGNTVAGSVETLQATQAVSASATVAMGLASRPGVIKEMRIAAITPLTGNATLTVNILKNGVSILTGATPQSFPAATPARGSVLGTLAVPNTPVAVGDFFEAVFVFVIGTGTAAGNVVAQIQMVQN